MGKSKKKIRPVGRVAKRHRYGRYICVKILEGWGKKCRRPQSFVKWSSFDVISTNIDEALFDKIFSHSPLEVAIYLNFIWLKHWICHDLCALLGVKIGLKELIWVKNWHFATLIPPLLLCPSSSSASKTTNKMTIQGIMEHLSLSPGNTR